MRFAWDVYVQKTERLTVDFEYLTTDLDWWYVTSMANRNIGEVKKGESQRDKNNRDHSSR